LWLIIEKLGQRKCSCGFGNYGFESFKKPVENYLYYNKLNLYSDREHPKTIKRIKIK